MNSGREPIVLVPTGEHPATEMMAPGSGIVGRPDGSSLTEIYFEGAGREGEGAR